MSAKKPGKGTSRRDGKPKPPRRRKSKVASVLSRTGSTGAAPGAAPKRAKVTPAPATAAPSRAGRRPRSPVAAAASATRGRVTVVPGKASVIGGPIIVDPNLPVFKPDPIGNFFDRERPGQAVVRAADLVALRVELHNLTIQTGSPPRLKKTGSGAAHVVLHFPPQAITEETFFEARPAGTTNPEPPRAGTPDKPEPGGGGSEELTGPPVRARISGESRLVFTVPDGFETDYTLAGVLAAVEDLALSVPANAKPPSASESTLVLANIFSPQINRLTASQRAALSNFAVRSLRIAALQKDVTTLELRQAIGGPGVQPLRRRRVAGRRVAGAVTRPKARPALPSAMQTAIELPWRLILSPHSAERWRHAKSPAASLATHRTELWHSRLVAPQSDGTFIEPPRPDGQRTVRAVWALTGEGSTKAMQSQFPVAADLPAPNTSPFRMPLDDFDRFQITHLSSNFSVSNYVPRPVGTNLLMLSALGGWLDSRGNWDPPGLSVEEWVHRATMARDHYVRVVYKGFLFPFGHRVALVKVSERKFHNGAVNNNGVPTIEQKTGNTAYLRQRLFIVVRERERRFVDPTLTNKAGTVYLHRRLPFASIRILTTVTPNLDQPNSAASRIDPIAPGDTGQMLFWPCVNGQPFKFVCAATDLDGRTVQFELPMIFMDNTMASPRNLVGDKLVADFDAAEANAVRTQQEWATTNAARADRRVAQLKQQRVALAQSLKAGDTTVQADEISFDAFVEKKNQQLRTYSDNLSRPVFYPMMAEARVRIAALAQLTGSAKNNKVVWNAHYLQNGFAASNQGQVFVEVAAEPGMAQLDFSTQGDRSGGFVQPNLKPSAISRLTGPVTGEIGDFVAGTLKGADAFPATLSDLPLPLLFGCIPLGDVIQTVTGLAGKPEQIPKFASEASTQVEDFINGLTRLFEFVTRLADQPGRIGEAAIAAVKSTLQDLVDQAQAYAAPLVADVKTRLSQVVTALNTLLAQVQLLKDQTIDGAPALPGLPAAITGVQGAVTNLRNTANAQVGGVALPAGFRQGVLQVASQLDGFTGDLATITALLTQAKTVYTALDAIVGHPEQLGDLLSNPAQLATKLQAVQAAITPLRTTLAGFRLLEGAPRQVVLDAIDLVLQVLGGDLLNLLEMLTGDELTIRFDWNPPISNWALPGPNPDTAPLFRANDTRGFLVAVEAKVKKNGQSAPKIGVVCSLKHFDLVLIAPASFIELNFEKIEFRVDSGAKMDVDVLLTDIKFVGPLSFVETLRDLIPLDGFSDPPYLDITPQGIDSGFSLTLPNVAVGVFNLSNLNLGAGFTVPFIGQPLAVRFNFCTREQPFNLTVSLFGGGGFFAITLDPHGIQILEAAFEFGASISIDFGVASGGVHVMAGLYFRMEQTACALAGYFRLGGHVSVLGLISASLELYLALGYEFESGKCVGKAQLTIEVEVFMFSTSVTITCERKFAGSNGDPSFRDVMGTNPMLPLASELASIDDTTAYAWREYCEAFA
jgi:hypothetical protein